MNQCNLSLKQKQEDIEEWFFPIIDISEKKLSKLDLKWKSYETVKSTKYLLVAFLQLSNYISRFCLNCFKVSSRNTRFLKIYTLLTYALLSFSSGNSYSCTYTEPMCHIPLSTTIIFINIDSAITFPTKT